MGPAGLKIIRKRFQPLSRSIPDNNGHVSFHQQPRTLFYTWCPASRETEKKSVISINVQSRKNVLILHKSDQMHTGIYSSLTYSGLSFLSDPLTEVFSSLSMIGPIISSSFILSSSWMISISLTGSTQPSTWIISSSSKAPTHKALRIHITGLFEIQTYGTKQQVSHAWLKSKI